jgi:hypothetical protein
MVLQQLGEIVQELVGSELIDPLIEIVADTPEGPLAASELSRSAFIFPCVHESRKSKN